MRDMETSAEGRDGGSGQPAEPVPPGPDKMPGSALVLPGDQVDYARVRRYLDEAKAATTRRGYGQDADHFAIWCADHHYRALPADPLVVADYLTELADAGYKPATIMRRASGIAYAHRQAGRPPPTTNPGVREVLQGIRREAAHRGLTRTRARGLTLPQLIALVADLPDTTAGIRDRALLLVGYALGLRASDLAGLDRTGVEPARDGYDIHLRISKTDQLGAGETLALAPGAREATCPVTALRRWLELLDQPAGPLFRSVSKSGRIGDGRLVTSSVHRILRRAAGNAGISLDRLSPHSLRRGFATTAYAAGVPEAEIARTGRWKTLTVMRDYNDAERWTKPASGGLGL
jgi:integrase